MQTRRQSTEFRPAPDFEGRYKKAMLRQGEPDRVPLSDFSIDTLFNWRLAGPSTVMLSHSEASPGRYWSGPGRCFAVAQHDRRRVRIRG
ncbi:MAG: hypothetical protein HY331_04445 [Chloroflexi bacterium]|nr:hypothetical protein [Chloroflexota bacterium]